MMSNAPNNHARPEAVLALEEQVIRNSIERACQAEEVGKWGKLRGKEMVGDQTTHYEVVEMLWNSWSDAV